MKTFILLICFPVLVHAQSKQDMAKVFEVFKQGYYADAIEAMYEGH